MRAKNSGAPGGATLVGFCRQTPNKRQVQGGTGRYRGHRGGGIGRYSSLSSGCRAFSVTFGQVRSGQQAGWMGPWVCVQTGCGPGRPVGWVDV